MNGVAAVLQAMAMYKPRDLKSSDEEMLGDLFVPIHSHLLVSSEPDGSEGGPSELQASRVLLPDLGSSRFRCSLIHQSCACSHPEINMFKNTFQSGFLSILYSLGSKPLQIWDKEIANGQIKRPQDDDIQSNVLEIVGSNVQSTYITCPADPAATLGIKLPFLVMIVKNLKKYFTFEIQVLDDKNVRRRFRASNFQSVTRVKPFICTMPLKLEDGWNNIQWNLADFTRRAYGTNYVETLRVQVHANCRLRRIYFSDRLYSEEELPPEFKLYLPMQKV
uniref:Cilia- and flagella-associated protein 20 isoform X2 n=2 Tax=Elaeis guineensis var. tenera TaxID=51953 RepID=A0A6I9QJI8_ELAGV|nr:cilia- and flagella-associated protein 20 isoform X2 [Elaeis guineensis]